MKIEIKSWLNGSVIFTCEALDLRAAVVLAVEKNISLSGADLRSADLRSAVLSGADLSGAVLSGADLRSAVLSCAVLSGAVLSGAVLRSADLRSADLRSAVLSCAVLSGADLSGAVLSGADLSGAVLSGAVLSGADLSDFKTDFLTKLKKAMHEAPALYKKLVDGKIDGSCYEGECSCFCGTIATAKGINYRDLEREMDITPNGSSPVEKWFAAIMKGDTPDRNPVAAITKEWMEEFMQENGIAVPKRSVVWS